LQNARTRDIGINQQHGAVEFHRDRQRQIDRGEGLALAVTSNWSPSPGSRACGRLAVARCRWCSSGRLMTRISSASRETRLRRRDVTGGLERRQVDVDVTRRGGTTTGRIGGSARRCCAWPLGGGRSMRRLPGGCRNSPGSTAASLPTARSTFAASGRREQRLRLGRRNAGVFEFSQPLGRLFDDAEVFRASDTGIHRHPG
jgi:hypothetical protein